MLKEELLEKRLTPRIDEPSEIVREVKVQVSKSKTRNYSQYFIQIPTPVVEELEIKKGDVIVFKVPLDNKKGYSIRLKRKVS